MSASILRSCLRPLERLVAGEPPPSAPSRGTVRAGDRGPDFGVRVPPAPMPPVNAGRLLKRWRYVGVYGQDVMLCVGSARVGPVGQEFWALWDRGAGQLHEHTSLLLPFRRRAVTIDRTTASVRDGAAAIDLRIAGGGKAVEVLTPDGRAYAWTRKEGAARATGRVTIGAESHEIDGFAIVDESAGYHPRHTSWRWSAGIGVSEGGEAVAWNLVRGIHDSPESSERTVWRDGEPTEVGPVEFAPDLGSVRFSEGGALSFEAESERRRDENILLIRSSYRQPFGTFSGTLAKDIRLREGFGVMEEHEAVW